MIRFGIIPGVPANEALTFCVGRTAITSEQWLCAATTSNMLVQPGQTHSTNVAIITPNNLSTTPADTDAVVTAMPHVAISIRTADCVPILIYDRANHIAAAIHAGWRGTAAHIVGNAVDAMLSIGASTDSMLCYIGVAISLNNYEVGDELIAQFSSRGFNINSIALRNHNTGKYHIDLRKANFELLTGLGINPNHITIDNTCTFASPHYYSARRNGIATGRNITGIALF